MTNSPQFLLETAKFIENELAITLQQLQLPRNLEDATTYAVMNGGKRVRPALTILCAEAVGNSKESVISAAIAVEFIHCFSLIHDDLPSIDNDDLRRGKPTLHIHAGEAMALLAGDILLPLAFSQLSNAPVDSDKKNELFHLLATATKDMVVGQVFDTVGGLPETLSPKDQLLAIHQNKTGALIQCACELGAVCSDATTKQREAIHQYGKSIGLMFQIVDDLIDLNGSKEHVGKATRKDSDAGKTTYPSVLGEEASKTAIEELKKQADNALDVFGDDAETLRSFNLWLAQRTR